MLRHDQALAIKDVHLTAVAMHDPGAQDGNGYVVETPDVAILHGGDSLYFDGFRALARRWTLDAILVSVGVSLPGETLYMDEADAARAACDSGARTLIPQVWWLPSSSVRRIYYFCRADDDGSHHTSLETVYRPPFVPATRGVLSTKRPMPRRSEAEPR